MKQRALDLLTAWFPYLLAAALPLAGVILAGARALEGRREEAAIMGAAALLGALVWLTVLTG